MAPLLCCLNKRREQWRVSARVLTFSLSCHHFPVFGLGLGLSTTMQPAAALAQMPFALIETAAFTLSCPNSQWHHDKLAVEALDAGKPKKKRKRRQKSESENAEAEGLLCGGGKGREEKQALTWTDESVKYLFRSYEAIHQRLWEESKGQVKYQKKWAPIVKAMQDRFGQHFSKKQCQSKYWSVRRECTDYMHSSAKIARSEPAWNPSIAGRELLKPKFYDVWMEVSGKDLPLPLPLPPQAAAKTTAENDLGIVDHSCVKEWKQQEQECIQRLMRAQLKAGEEREAAIKYQAEMMMELLTQQMAHAEKTGPSAEDSRKVALERLNEKLEKVLEGFDVLNHNITAAIGWNEFMQGTMIW